MNLGDRFNVRPIFLNKRYDSFAIVFGNIFCFVFYLLYWLGFWGVDFYRLYFYFRWVNLGFYLLTFSWFFRFFLNCIHIIFLLRKSWVFANNPIIMVSLVRHWFWSCIDKLIHQTKALFSCSWGPLKLKNWLDLNGFLFKFKVLEYTFEDIGRAVIWSNVRAKGGVFKVWKETISFNEAHKSNSTNKN